LAAVGPKTLKVAGESFDGAILHPFLTPAAVGRSVELLRLGAVAAGRDPDSVRTYATVVVAPDASATDTDLAVHSRAAAYFHVAGLGDALVTANQWDPQDLAQYRGHPTLRALGVQQADKALPRDELARLAHTLPDHWLASSSAMGSATQCAARLHEYIDAGADELILHGTTVEHLGRLPACFGETR
jgi:alkanesulfonate monooxygenase SsuD/methylene tetrahydromethanopterin reductase-like flavin-dependent oxidoreductase (luciferase family)